MYDFHFSIPTEIYFGIDCEERVGYLMKACANKVMMVYGSERIFADGLGNRILDSLNRAGCQVVLCGGVRPNAGAAFIRKGISLARTEAIDGVLAVGGGSVIDSAKAIAAGACFDGDVMELYTRPEAQPELFLPVGAVVTIPATASESNEMSVISDERTGKKVAKPFPQVKPRFALLNPQLTVTVSGYQTACGGFDLFSHGVERYFDLSRDSLLFDAMTEGLLRTVLQVLPQVIEEPEDLRLRGELMVAANVAHNDMLGPGGDFACHEMSHLLTERFGLAHGAALAMIFPAWCKLLGEAYPQRFCQFYERVFSVKGDNQAEILQKGQQALETFIRTIGLSLTFAEAGIAVDTGEIPALAEATLDGRPFIGWGLAPLKAEEIAQVYRQFM